MPMKLSALVAARAMHKGSVGIYVSTLPIDDEELAILIELQEFARMQAKDAGDYYEARRRVERIRSLKALQAIEAALPPHMAQ